MFVSFLRRHVTKKGVYSPQTQGAVDVRRL
jgi:hypothetical protein